MSSATENKAVVLDGHSLTLEQVEQVARHYTPVELAPDVLERLDKERGVVLAAARSDKPYYGINTGTGANKNVRIPEDLLSTFQQRVIESHCIGVGPCFSEDVVRAIMVTRANALAHGGTGVQPDILLRYLQFLNEGIHPVTPMRSSVGMADLGPLAEMALSFIGKGEVFYQGRRMRALDALELAGISPITLGPKDGMVLCSHNAVSIGHGALVLSDCLRLLETAEIAAMLHLEAYRGNVSPLDRKVAAYRPYPGQAASLEAMHSYLEGSFLWKEGSARSVQDPLSFRCAVQVHGACRDAWQFAKEAMNIELNAVGDNPLVLADEELLVSHGNFDIISLAMRFELLGIQLAALANLIANRLNKIMTPEFSDLPKFLSPNPGVCCGFSTLQKTYLSLAAEIRHKANPGMLDCLQAANGVEDHATMAPFVIQKTAEIISDMHYLVGIELMVAAQAIDLCDPLALGKGTKVAYEMIRQFIPMLEEDRVLSADIRQAHQLVATGRVLQHVKQSINQASHSRKPNQTEGYVS